MAPVNFAEFIAALESTRRSGKRRGSIRGAALRVAGLTTARDQDPLEAAGRREEGTRIWDKNSQPPGESFSEVVAPVCPLARLIRRRKSPTTDIICQSICTN